MKTNHEIKIGVLAWVKNNTGKHGFRNVLAYVLNKYGFPSIRSVPPERIKTIRASLHSNWSNYKNGSLKLPFILNHVYDDPTKPNHAYGDPEPNQDPKGVEGDKKTPLQLLPPVFMAAVAWALKTGFIKYGPWNWRKQKVECQTYVGAIRRHLDAWQDGQDIDPESGLNHLAHVGACVAIILDAEANGTLVDNRPLKINKEKS